jgi:hypothetical protein
VAVVREDDEDEEQLEGDCRDHEEVGGHDLARVIGEESAPRLGRWTRKLSHVFGHCGFTGRDPQLQ